MKSALFALMLAAASAHAEEWIPINDGDDHKGEHHILAVAPEVMFNKGMAAVWVIGQYDEGEPLPSKGGRNFVSYKSRREFNCAEQKARYSVAYFYAGSWGQGRVVQSVSDLPWHDVVPGSAEELVKRYACEKSVRDYYVIGWRRLTGTEKSPH